MANVWRIQAELSGWSGGPGINTFHFTADPLENTNANDMADMLHTMYTELIAGLIAGVTVNIIPVVRRFDDATGELLDVSSLSSRAPIISPAATSSGNLSRATMAKLGFITDVILRNRVLRGGIYFGPINEVWLTEAGEIHPDTIAQIVDAFEGLIAPLEGAGLAVWSQPREVIGDDGEPFDRPGKVGDVKSVLVASQPAVLRSRRD